MWPEPFSRKMVEATFFGEPIVETDNGGNSEGVIDGVNGYLVNNEKELTEKLQKLVDNKSLREKMGAESRKLYEKKFTKEIIINKYKEAYTN